MPASTVLPILYSFRRCPYAMRARMALHHAGVQVEHREVALRDKPAALRAISPKATVPVLQLPDGTVIDESLDILHWALAQCDPGGWAGPEVPADAPDWVRRNDVEFKPLLDRAKYAERFPEDSLAGHRERALAAFVRPLDARLRDMPFLGSLRTCWADVAVFPFVRQFALADAAWFHGLPLPGVQRWLAHWLDAPAFTAVMDKRPIWQEAA